MQVLRHKLAQLQEFRKRRHHDIEQDYDVWHSATWAAFEHGFGPHSRQLTNFSFAHYAKRNRNEQEDFELVTAKEETAIRAAIEELEMSLPEAQLKGAYDAGDEFAFYKDLKGIVSAASNDLFIIDNFLNTDFFELYVEPIPTRVSVRILTDQVRGNLQAVAQLYARRGNFELRSSKDVHDRHIFIDGRGWIVGQSIKDAAKKKPTTVIELDAALVPTVQKIYEDIWSRATVVAK